VSVTALPAASAVEVADGREVLDWLPREGGAAWVRHGEGLVAWGEVARYDPGAGPARWPRAAGWLRDTLPPGAVAFAGFTFDPERAGSVLTVPAAVLRRGAGRTTLTTLGAPLTLPRPSPSVRLVPARRLVYRGSSIPELAWMEAVAAVAAEVRGGTGLRKAVLARDVVVDAAERLDPRLLAGRLAERFPGCWTFLVDGLIGATPELLVRRSGRRVSSLVLAGSTRRGADADDDAAVGDALRRSAKDTHEHALSVASVRDVLAPLTTSLAVDPRPRLLRLANVQHLATAVEGELADPAVTALDLAAALHPTAAVCGTPRDLALDRIRALEGMDRGRYAGPVGWIDATGDGQFGIALRCAELTPTGARLFAGAGVVGGSLPEAELDETRLKLRAMQSALEG